MRKKYKYKDPNRKTFEDYKPCKSCGRVVCHWGHAVCERCTPKKEWKKFYD